MKSAIIPQDILIAFELQKISKSKQIKSGLINDTYLISSRGKSYILQRLDDSIFNEKYVEDAVVISDHLTSHGVESPNIIQSKEGSSYRDKNANLWRMMKYIDNDGEYPDSLSDDALYAIGKLLADWHKSAARLDYKPTFAIPHYRDNSHYSSKLRSLIDRFEHPSDRKLAEEALQIYSDLPKQSSTEKQLIHADPRIKNILFKNHMPVALVDIDTLYDTIYIDLGLLINSLFELRHARNMRLSSEDINTVIRGYFENADLNISFKVFYRRCRDAAINSSLEEMMRFLIDIVEANYFQWDEQKFTSRRDNHLYIVEYQRKILQEIQEDL